MTGIVDLGEHRIVVARATTDGLSRSWCPSRRYYSRDNFQSHPYRHRPGDWIVHCLLCKDRARLADRDDALHYAREQHPGQAAHQRWLGLLAQGWELPEVRGYDAPGSHQNPRHGVHDRPRVRQVPVVDELAARRRHAPPQIEWLLTPAKRRVTVSWPDGTCAAGTEYWLMANGRRVDDVIALDTGGWLLGDRWFPDQTNLGHALRTVG